MAFVAGKNTLSSGTGSWTLVTPPDVTIATDDPDTRNPILAGGTPVPQADFALFPTVQLVFTLTADGTSTVQVVGDDSTEHPNPADSIGFTANMQISVVNDTGHAISGLTFNLSNDTPSLPYNLGNSVVHYGEAIFDANYAYFTMIQPTAGETTTLFTPTGAPTTAAGAAPSQMDLTGNIAAGATVTSDMVVHNTELETTDNNFNLSVTDTAGDPPANFLVADQTSGQVSQQMGTPYNGPVAGLTSEFITATPDNINVTATVPNVFIHTGSGEDALSVSTANGNNVLDGSTGSNFLVGGTGDDTFFVDDRGATASIWSTVAGFHSGDNATVWGVTPSDFALAELDNQGAAGFTGLTFQFTAPGAPTADLTLAGFSTADLSNGRLAVSFGTTPDQPGLPGSNYMLVHGV